MAARYWVGGNANWDATAGTKWSLTSGGAGGQAVPTSSDDVFLDNGTGTGNVTISATANCKSLDCTGYIGTLAGSSQLTSAGSVKFVAGMTLTYSGTLIVNTTATLTSGGLTFPGNLTLAGTSITYTIADNWTISGLLLCNGVTATTINGAFTLTLAGGYTQTTVGTVSGTTSFKLTGGTWTSTLSTNSLRVPLEFAGNVTLATNVAYSQGTILYTSGTITVAGSTLTCATGCTFNTNGMSWNNVVLAGTSQTYTLSSDLDINGLFTCNGTTATTINGLFNIKVGGGYTQTTVATVNGTASFLFDGTGTWTSTLNTNVLRCNTTINLAGTLTFAAQVAFNTGVFTYIAGTVNVTTNSNTFNCLLGATLDTAGMSFNHVNLRGGTVTYTLSSNMDVNGNLLILTSTLTTTVNGFQINVAGGIDLSSGSTGLISGTTVIVMDGTGTITPATSTGSIRVPFTINTAGTITFGTTGIGYVRFVNNTVTYTTGTLVTIGSIIRFAGCSVVLNAAFSVDTITLETANNFSGSVGFTTNTLNIITISVSHTLKNGNTYTVNTAFASTTTTAAAHSGFISDVGGSQANFILGSTATQDIGFTDALDINSSGGKTICSYKGVLSNATNWRLLPVEVQTRGSMF